MVKKEGNKNKMLIKCVKCGSLFEYKGYGRPSSTCPKCSTKKKYKKVFIGTEVVHGTEYLVYLTQDGSKKYFEKK